ncbi:MAG: hypothetical protein QM541_05145 [Flavobacterium sp.]|nr:hypothetical protein [Flavobacterium sp.]
MATTQNNILLHGMSGHLGKQLVVKQYATKTVISKYPDMTNVKPSPKQLAEKSRFSKAVKYAQEILNNPELKATYLSKVAVGQSVYHYAIKEYLASH